MCQAIFRCLLYRLRIGQACSRGLFLSHESQQAVIGLLYLENDVAMCVVKCKVGCQNLSFRSVDSASPGPEVENPVVEIHRYLKFLDGLPDEQAPKQDRLALGPGQCSSCQCRIQLAASDAQ